MLPMYALPFGFRFMIMNPGFIPSDDAIQEVISFNLCIKKLSTYT
jgi:hypothetical protein